MINQAAPLIDLSRYVIDESHLLDLVRDLCNMLTAEKINYCHWKSNVSLDRSARGENDLDLLIARSDAESFNVILYTLGFKEFYTSSENSLPGIRNYYGYDRKTLRLVHLHAHYQLMIGNDFTKSYHLPIEKPYLESAHREGLFRIPAPEFELVVFTIRMMLKHATWDSILGKQGKLSPSEQQELKYLSIVASMEKVYKILAEYLPVINADIFDGCLRAIQSKTRFWFRIRVSQQLLNALRDCNRRTQITDIFLKGQRRIQTAFQRRLLKSISKLRPSNGGMIIAFVGGDGAGKTTSVEHIEAWLSKHFNTQKIHLGKPTWSTTTILVRAMIKIGRIIGFYPFVTISTQEMLDPKEIKFPGYPWMLREVCTARDRYLMYHKARQLASNGRIVICDRFPLKIIKLMDGLYPVDAIANLFPQKIIVRNLARIVNKYYQSILLPELLIVLKVDPDVAVLRKADEDETFVRARSSEIWNSHFRGTKIRVINANQDMQAVLSEIREIIWSEI